jgi:hypothetical protein
LALAVASSAACAQSQEAAIKKMIQRQITAMNKCDVGGYMATVDPSVPQYEQTKQTMTMLFSKYKLKATVESVKVAMVSSDTAKVTMTVVTSKISGPAFRNNRMVSINTVVKRNGKWLTSATKVSKLDYLD